MHYTQTHITILPTNTIPPPPAPPTHTCTQSETIYVVTWVMLVRQVSSPSMASRVDFCESASYRVSMSETRQFTLQWVSVSETRQFTLQWVSVSETRQFTLQWVSVSDNSHYKRDNSHYSGSQCLKRDNSHYSGSQCLKRDNSHYSGSQCLKQFTLKSVSMSKTRQFNHSLSQYLK